MTLCGLLPKQSKHESQSKAIFPFKQQKHVHHGRMRRWILKAKSKMSKKKGSTTPTPAPVITVTGAPQGIVTKDQVPGQQLEVPLPAFDAHDFSFTVGDDAHDIERRDLAEYTVAALQCRPTQGPGGTSPRRLSTRDRTYRNSIILHTADSNNNEVFDGDILSPRPGFELDRRHGFELDRRHGFELDRRHGFELDRRPGSCMENDNSPFMPLEPNQDYSRRLYNYAQLPTIRNRAVNRRSENWVVYGFD